MSASTSTPIHCQRCNGAGYFADHMGIPGRRCPDCGGSGRTPNERPEPPPPSPALTPTDAELQPMPDPIRELCGLLEASGAKLIFDLLNDITMTEGQRATIARIHERLTAAGIPHDSLEKRVMLALDRPVSDEEFNKIEADLQYFTWTCGAVENHNAECSHPVCVSPYQRLRVYVTALHQRATSLQMQADSDALAVNHAMEENERLTKLAADFHEKLVAAEEKAEDSADSLADEFQFSDAVYEAAKQAYFETTGFWAPEWVQSEDHMQKMIRKVVYAALSAANPEEAGEPT